MEESNTDTNSVIANLSAAEKLGWILVLFAFIVGTWGVMGEYAAVGVMMAAIGALIGLIKKNWILLVIGLIDAVILISFMHDISEINSIMNSY